MALNAQPADDPTDDELLPCGRSLADVWDARLAEDHRADCPHCAAALEELRVLDDFVSRACGSETEAGPADAEALTARVMDIVRLELRPGRSLPLGEPDEDSWVFESAAARALRAASDALPGVRTGSCRIAPDGQTTRVEIEVAVAWSWKVPEVSEAVRTRVAAAAKEALGMAVHSVDVRVIDILDEREGSGR
ncbi:Asp23/Gls24 family envelope stress response protein [Streptomyces hypolithicus]